MGVLVVAFGALAALCRFWSCWDRRFSVPAILDAAVYLNALHALRMR